jgi:hypothetical protein
MIKSMIVTFCSSKEKKTAPAINRFHLLVGLLLTMISVSSVYAEPVKKIYTQRILVVDQSDQHRKQAASDALAKVLVRVTGLKRTAQDIRLKGLLSNAEAYVQSFYYESSKELILYRDQEVQASTLVLSFSSKELEKLLRSYELPIWPANRPSILVWMVQDSVAGRTITPLDGDSEMGSLLASVSDEMGLPLVLPMLDLQDQQSINTKQLWDLDFTSIGKASQRYLVDAILVGRYSQTSSGLWLASWSLLHKGRQLLFDGQGQTQAELIDAGLTEVTEYLAGLYSIVTDDSMTNALTMAVSGINNFADYVELLAYMDGLAVVNKSMPAAVRGNELVLKIYLNGDLALLLDALELDNKLGEDSTVDLTTIGLSSSGFSNRESTTQQGSTENPQVWIQPRGSELNPLRFTWP